MLCKVKSNDGVTQFYGNASGASVGASSLYTIATATSTNKGHIKLHINSIKGNKSLLEVALYVNDVQVYDITYNDTNSREIDYVTSDIYNSGSTVVVKARGNDGNGFSYNGVYLSTVNYIYLGAPYYNCYPLRVDTIGSTTQTALYWVFNGTYKGGVMLGKSSEATTGSIPLWNATWFIKVYYNGEYIKIPYYGN